QGGFATLVRFSHLAETYALKAGVYVDREALIRREKALVAVRPVLTVNNRFVSLKLLEEPRLVIRSTDLKGIVTEKEFAGLVLREDAETVQEIQVPEGAVELAVTLKARIQNLSQGKKQDLQDGGRFALNGIERTADVQALHAGQSVAGYYVDARGKNGEPLPGEPLECFFKHRCFRSEVQALLKTDAQGRAALGALAGIERFRIKAAEGRELSWSPSCGACAYPEALHGKTGETLRLPLVGEAADPLSGVSLLEVRHGQFVKDWHAALAVKDGFLEVSGLSAGDYSLALKAEGRELAVRVTQGDVRDGFVVSPRRALERPRLAPLNVVSITPGKESVEIRLANVSPFTRVHVYAARYLPAYDLFGQLGHSGAPGLLAQQWQPARTFYESGRDIGDEYRYILDRQQAAKYPGNMLERPGLLLNPWAVRPAEAESERLAEGNAYAGRRAGVAQAAGVEKAAERQKDAGNEGYIGLDFLEQPSVSLLNVVPDKEGKVVIPREALKGLPFLRVLAVDPTAAVLKCAALENTPVGTRELRLADGLDPKKGYAEQKRITTVAVNAAVTVGDVTTARFEAYDTVAKAYRLLATLSADATLGEFSFVADWPGLDAKEQRRLYAKYACHELSFFLYHKDPAFFAKVIAPYLKNKKDKTFMDRWLLGDDLSGYLEPWRFGRLNAAERVLLGKRLRGQEASLARDTRERAALIPPDMEAFNRRFDTAVQSGALEADADGASGGNEEYRKLVGVQRAVKLMAAQTGAKSQDLLAPASALERAPAAAPMAAKPMLARALRFDKDKADQPGDEKKARALKMPRQRAVRGNAMDKEEEAADAPSAAGAVFFDARNKDRETLRRFFQKLDQTQEWAENNYWHLPIE
ncbi:MAG: hypothetical protein PHV28_19225, partial [Kiritimatiellae bacterium]|nr:hypothetical protein [Kiritimatiellia bacterium]